MLAAIDATSLLVLVTFGLAMALIQAVKRGSRRFRNSLEVRDGRVALSDAARLKLARRGADLNRIDALIAKNFSVNEQGEIVERGNVAGVAASAPKTAGNIRREPVEQEKLFNLPVAGNESGGRVAKARPLPAPRPHGRETSSRLYRKPSVQDLLRGGDPR